MFCERATENTRKCHILPFFGLALTKALRRRGKVYEKTFVSPKHKTFHYETWSVQKVPMAPLPQSRA